MTTPVQRGKTPSEMAADGVDGLRQVEAILRKHRQDRLAAVRAEDIRKTMVGRLHDGVYRRILRRDVAYLWLTQQWPGLDGAKPVDYCKDEKPLARGLDVLEVFAATERKPSPEINIVFTWC